VPGYRASSFDWDGDAVVVRGKLFQVVISTVCGAVAVSGAQLAAPSTAAAVSISTVAVPPGCTSQPTHVGFERRPQCVAKANVKTRGYGIGRCITDPRTLDLSYATYTYGDCRGTKLIQAEAIAQARAIVNLNLMLAAEVPKQQVSTQVQWEVSPGASRQRPDIGIYDPTDEAAPIGLIEVKGTWPGAEGADAASEQLDDYIALWSTEQPDSNGARRYAIPEQLENDRFLFDLGRPCDDDTDIKAFEYSTHAMTGANSAGVLLVNRDPIYCGTSRTEPPVSPDQPPGPTDDGGCYAPFASDADSNGRDDFLDCLHEYAIRYGPEALKHAIPHVILEGAARAYMSREAIRATFAGWRTIVAAQMAARGEAVVTRLMERQAFQMLAQQLARVAASRAALATIGTSVTVSMVVAAVAVVVVLAILADRKWNLWGDPHLVTLDGLSYDLQSAGEFHLVAVSEHDIDVQARFVPVNGVASVMDSLAFELGGSVVEIRSDGSALVDGFPVDLSDPETSGLNDFTDGYGLGYSDGEYVAVFPTGEVLSTDGRNVSFMAPDGVRTEGLLGDHDGIPGNDLVTSDGEQIAAAAVATIHGRYADSWRLTDDESFFTYAEGESTATFTDTTFPADIVTVDDFPANEIEAASDTCRAQQVPDGPQFGDCVLDVLITGDAGYATAAAATRDELVDPLANAFDGAGVLEEGFAAPVASNFAHSSYLDDPATGRVAGPIFDTPGYSFYAVDVPRHHRLQMTLDLIAYGPIGTDSSTQSVEVRLDGQAPIHATLDGDQPTVDSGSATVMVDRTGTTQDGTPFTAYELSVDSDHVGSALKVSLAPQNFRGVLGTSLGVDHARLDLNTTAADSFNVTLPFTVQAGQGPLGPTAGNLETVSAEDDYTFHVAQDNTRLLLDVDGCLGPRVSLHSLTSGNQIPADRGGCGDRVFSDVDAGDYVLKVWIEGAPTTYGLGLGEAPDPEVFTYQLGQRVADGQIADLPSPGAGNIETAGSQDTYTFTVIDPTATVAFWGSQGACQASRLIDTSSGQDLGSVCGRRQYTLSAGDYRIEVPSSAGEPTGAYWFESFVVSGDPVIDQAVSTDGTLATANLGEGQNAQLRFTAVGGERFRILVPASTLGYYDQVLRVVAPDGTTVIDAYAGTDSAFYVESAQAGEYRVELDPLVEDSATVTVRVKDISDVQIVAPVDGSDNVVALDPGQNAQLRFTAAGGERFRILVPASTLGYYDQVLRVVAPDGTTVIDAYAGTDSAFYVESAQAGEYRVELDPLVEDSATVTVQIATVT